MAREVVDLDSCEFTDVRGEGIPGRAGKARLPVLEVDRELYSRRGEADSFWVMPGP